ncbi:hypothetical protein GCM10022243_43050 [Saccharothrix violaceirubra]|uniref:Phenylpyruvate tautomerase PptA (4-oxalocrotonate tautomerase family) n=1 Tax=Saccharothrix violaceirubra TaxID=413306 RepID=A0A7W7T2X6_9PSEU|nr:hypothetical protein [Saccharothrix violaceirubra]MBB4965593.1 phenylpyruvate tautomerase PptA (4-oxalocrotonate tautomerase family) [Saccharothrix violaceirubra]
MPTITITTTKLSTARRRAVAVRLTRWLSTHGSERGHVVVRFESTEEGTVYIGGMPVEALPYDDGLRHAAVTCCVAPDRDEAYRAALAAEIGDALGLTAGTPFLYVEFRPTPLDQVHYGAAGKLRRADAT